MPRGPTCSLTLEVPQESEYGFFDSSVRSKDPMFPIFDIRIVCPIFFAWKSEEFRNFVEIKFQIWKISARKSGRLIKSALKEQTTVIQAHCRRPISI